MNCNYFKLIRLHQRCFLVLLSTHFSHLRSAFKIGVFQYMFDVFFIALPTAQDPLHSVTAPTQPAYYTLTLSPNPPKLIRAAINMAALPNSMHPPNVHKASKPR